jgi:hypothetical protein
MGSQQRMCIEIKGVMHGARRMIFRDVKRLEIVIIVLDLGALGHLKAGVRKQLFDAIQRLCYRMQTTSLLPPARQGDIDGFRGQALLYIKYFKFLFTSLDSLLQILLGLIDGLPRPRSFFRGKIS